MDRTDTVSLKTKKKLNIITTVLIAVGAVISICLVFLFIQLFKVRNDSIKPKIYDVKQIGATDSSILLVWSTSKNTGDFIVRYSGTDGGETGEFHTDNSFAAIHGLKPYQSYKAVIIPVENETEYDPVSVICKTSPYCNVTEVGVDSITYNSAHVTWRYDGIDEGFTVAAYAVDQNGKRRVTSQVINIPKGSANECVFDKLLSELMYSVCVMPNTKYAQAKKSTFLTEKYSNLYNKYFISRFVTCSFESEDQLSVDPLTKLSAGQPYKTSLIVSGAADPTEKADMEIYITDSEGRITDHEAKQNVILNTDPEKPFFYRSFIMDFTAPSEQGEYSVYAVIDGETVKKNNFTVE